MHCVTSVTFLNPKFTLGTLFQQVIHTFSHTLTFCSSHQFSLSQFTRTVFSRTTHRLLHVADNTTITSIRIRSSFNSSINPGIKEHETDADSTTSPGSTLWKMEYCSLRCPDIITQGNVLNVEFTRGSDHCTTSFVQLYYIDKKPWMLRSRLGSFQSFPQHLQSGTFQFQTKRLSANDTLPYYTFTLI